MVDVVKQLCIKSFPVTDREGKSWTAWQGEVYTTTKPRDDKDTVTVFSSYWVNVPKDHFVLVEDNYNEIS